MTDQERNEKFDSMMNFAEFTDNQVYTLCKMGLLEAPASTKYHGAYPGGLLEHSLMVTEKLLYLSDRLNLHWQRPQSPYIIGMLHDLCKCDQYIEDTIYDTGIGSPVHYKFNDKTQLKGHGDKSVMLAATITDLTEEEMLCIRYHMGAFQEGEMGLYSDAVKKYPNVLWVHTADMMASQIEGV